MSAPEMVTERAKIFAQREAFEAGARWHHEWFQGERRENPKLVCAWNREAGESEAIHRYRLPKLLRQRFVRDPQTAHWEWTVEDGEIELVVSRGDPDHFEYRIKLHSGKCPSAFTPIRERIEIWADLLARPFDKFDDPSDSAGSPVSEAGR